MNKILVKKYCTWAGKNSNVHQQENGQPICSIHTLGYHSVIKKEQSYMGTKDTSQKHYAMLSEKKNQTQKSTSYMVLIMWSPRTGKINLWWQKSEQWLPLGSRGGNWLGKATRQNVLYVFLSGGYTGAYIVKIHQTGHLISEYFLHVNYTQFFKKSPALEKVTISNQTEWWGVSLTRAIFCHRDGGAEMQNFAA